MFDFLKKDEPVKIRFLFKDPKETRKRLTWDDLETMENLQSGKAGIGALKSLAARFMANEKDEYLPAEQAEKILGKLSADDIQDVLRQFTEALTGAAIPPQSARGLNSPSVVGQAEATPLAGSQP